METILCAAVFVETGEAEPPRRSYAHPKTGLIFPGWRHGDCLMLVDAWWRLLSEDERSRIEALNGDGCPWGNQGFLTSKGRYVDRKVGAVIAIDADQIEMAKITLFSEDLY